MTGRPCCPKLLWRFNSDFGFGDELDFDVVAAEVSVEEIVDETDNFRFREGTAAVSCTGQCLQPRGDFLSFQGSFEFDALGVRHECIVSTVKYQHRRIVGADVVHRADG